MTEYCPNKKYTYISTENFGDRKYVTEELLRAFCGNDAYFKRKIEELEDLTDPETKKRFNPPFFMDSSKSFGIISGTKDGKPIYKFNSNLSKNKIIDFNPENDNGYLYDDSFVDYASSNVEFYKEGNNCGARIKLQNGVKIVPVTEKVIHQNVVTSENESLDAYDRGSHGGILNVEGHWYVGFRKTKNYNLKPEWWLNPLSYSIPAVSRAQSFKAMKTGLLTSVNLALSVDETTVGDIYLEIRPIGSDGNPTTEVLARTTAKFTGSGSSKDKVMLKNFRFENACKVTAGVKYALVVRSSLGQHSQTYHLCGWDRRVKGEVYDRNHNGYAFVSYNNGKTWLRHTKETSAQLGLNHADTPLAFGFEVFIRETRLVTTEEEKTTYNTEEYTYYPKGNHELYINVPPDNPIDDITVTASTTTPTDTDVHFYISKDNRNWVDNGTSSGEGLYDETTCPSIFDTDSKPTFLFVKSVLTTDDIRVTPAVNDVTLTMNLLPSSKAYLRSIQYRPDKDIMLPANIWSEIDSNVENNYSNVGIDVIMDKEQEELFSLKYPTTANLRAIIMEYDSTQSLSDLNTDEKVKTYCTGNTEFLDYLKTLETPTYLLGVDDENNPFFTSLELLDYPAYPLLNMQSITEDIIEDNGDNSNWSYENGIATFTPPTALKEYLLQVTLVRKTNNSTETIELYEGTIGTKVDAENSRYADYYYDKTNNKLDFDITNSTLFKSYAVIQNNKIVGFKDPSDASKIYKLAICTLSTKYSEWLDYTVDYDNKTVTWEENGLSLIEGYLKVEYNPLFIRDLQPEDLPLKLDLWTETVTVLEDLNEYELRSYPVDSLRLVSLNYDTENEVILEEGVDFTVDYQNKKILFKNTITSETEITIKYTPALTDNGLSIGYRLDRTSTEQDCYIYDASFKTRT